MLRGQRRYSRQQRMLHGARSWAKRWARWARAVCTGWRLPASAQRRLEAPGERPVTSGACLSQARCLRSPPQQHTAYHPVPGRLLLLAGRPAWTWRCCGLSFKSALPSSSFHAQHYHARWYVHKPARRFCAARSCAARSCATVPTASFFAGFQHYHARLPGFDGMFAVPASWIARAARAASGSVGGGDGGASHRTSHSIGCQIRG
jgi:hypothetical protein